MAADNRNFLTNPRTRGQQQRQQTVFGQRRYRQQGLDPTNIVHGRRQRVPTVRGFGTPVVRRMVMGGVNRRVLDPGGAYIHRVNIPYTGTLRGDFRLANQRRGVQQPPRTTWHHFHDYNPQTNRGTMYLMRTRDHAPRHTGGAHQYRAHHHHGY